MRECVGFFSSLIGVVRATGHVGSHALASRGAARPQRHPRCRHGGADRAPGALGHGRAPRKTDLSLRCCRERAVRDGRNVVGRVYQRKFAIAGGRRLRHLNAPQFLHDAVPKQAVLGHWEAMAVWKRQHEVVGVEGLQEKVRLKRLGRLGKKPAVDL